MELELPTQTEIQHKLLNQRDCAFKVHQPGHGPTQFEGYASVFNGIDAYGDMIQAGAYANTLEVRDWPVLLKWNHFGPVIGKWLELREDDHGLFAKGELTPGHTTARNVAASMRHGAVAGLSIGYRVQDAEMRDDVMVLKEIELIEISVVENPADRQAVINDVKGIIDKAQSIKDLEAFLRDACGLSRSNATAFISKMRAVCLGDQGGRQTVGLGDQGPAESEAVKTDELEQMTSWLKNNLFRVEKKS